MVPRRDFRADPEESSRPTAAFAFAVGLRYRVEPQLRYLRVITLDDGETVHNAFFDRNFREGER